MKHRQDPEPETSDSQTDRIGIRDRAKAFIGTEQVGISCRLIRPDHIDGIWPDVEPHLERCVPHSEGELETEDFHQLLANGEMQLWLAMEDEEILAAMVSQIVSYPRKRILRIIAIGGGEMKRWLPFLPGLEEWALENGATGLECWGRKGWLKILDDWKCSYHVLTKDLKSRMH